MTPQQVDAYSLGTIKSFRKRASVSDPQGIIRGEVGLAPPIYIYDVMQEIRRGTSLPLNAIHDALQRAASIFKNGTVAGLTPNEYTDLASAVSGLPKTIFETSLTRIADVLSNMPDIVRASCARAAVLEAGDPRSIEGCSLVTRRGDVLGVIAAGNGPGVHALWLQAIAFGFRTVVKPSLREPFTAQRLALAVGEAGLQDYIAFLPTDHAGSNDIVKSSDLSIIYGGQEVVDRFRNNPTVLVQGPGRSKVVVGNDALAEASVRLVAESTASLAGAACVCASAALIEGDHIEFARKLASYFSIHENEFELPVATAQIAAIINTFSQQSFLLPQVPIPEAGARIRPIVRVADKADDPIVQSEYPFPCVTVAPFNRDTDLHVLSDTLVVTAFTRDHGLIDLILHDPTIANVYVGNVSTTWMADCVPHDGFLADFLTINRGFRMNAIPSVTNVVAREAQKNE
ncbi:aldehyde dehydrogenase family protein [Citrobacter freundii]|uniref:aldehyde dehydrogenase family protein n=2 Tax=Enterobacterales TaxID=91347 RepID=UPI000AA93AE0